ncbi:hypothetical protein M413DRAFT_65507, partial [Hebeloma cylindrosporum]
EWNPVRFRYPEIEPCTQALSAVKPIPYRPFRWGAYNITMGIRSMPWNEWIELDKDHGLYHKIKSHRLKTRGDRVVRVLTDNANPGVVKGGSEAAVELVHELAEYLSRRYPNEFQIVRHDRISGASESTGAFSGWGWEDQPPVKTVSITSLGVSFELPLSVADGDRAPERAMEIAGLLIQDDLAVMIEGKRLCVGVDGKYYFQAGSICLAGFWRLQDKIGMTLDDIHITGNVPQYKEKLQTSMERFFRRLPVDKAVIRNNYFVQVNRADEEQVDKEELGWAKGTLGPEDAYENGQHRLERSGDAKVEWIRLRTERQTLRRLPQSGGVVFTIRTYLTPIVDLEKEEGGRLGSALRSWPADVGLYKGREDGGWFRVLVEYLDDMIK